MDIIDAPQKVTPQGPIQGKIQSVAVLENLDPVMDDNAVRNMIVQAEAKGVDPESLSIADMSQGQIPVVEAPKQEVAPLVQESPKQAVPEKFLKTDGTVDVEKIQASTRQLDEAIQQKKEKLEAVKSVEDFIKDYHEREREFKNLPNPDKLAAQLPPPPVPQSVPDVSGMSTQQLEEMIRRDYQADPIMTMTRLMEIAIQKHLEPIKAREQDDAIRKNVESLAASDPRVLEGQNYEAVKAKLRDNPELWRLKNPHRAAWLEVKEELRLGESSKTLAQPSRPSPVLGGGTPPSVPSSQTPSSPQTILSNLDKLDLHDRRQELAGDEAIKAILAGRRF